MLVYPYIKSGVMSHGKAAEMLGLHKIDLITLYGKLGLPYFDETEEEFEEDLAVLKKLRGGLRWKFNSKARKKDTKMNITGYKYEKNLLYDSGMTIRNGQRGIFLWNMFQEMIRSQNHMAGKKRQRRDFDCAAFYFCLS